MLTKWEYPEDGLPGYMLSAAHKYKTEPFDISDMLEAMIEELNETSD